MLKELTKQLKALKNPNLKEISIVKDTVNVLTRRGKVFEISIEGLKHKEAIAKVVGMFTSKAVEKSKPKKKE